MFRLDTYDKLPSGMKRYLSAYGWHFSKNMYEWAVSMMKDRNGNKVSSISKQELEEALKKRNLDVVAMGYDGLYVYAMAKADFLGHSIQNEDLLYRFVYDYLGDKDGYDEVAFTRFYADTIAKGIPIIWDDML